MTPLPVMDCELFSRARVNTLKAAEIAGVTERTIYNWMRTERIEFMRTPTGHVRIFVDSLLRRRESSAA